MPADDHGPRPAARVPAPAPARRLGRRGRHTVAAIVECLVPSVPVVAPETRAAVLADVVGFVSAQIAAMPEFLRLPYGVAMIGFEWLPVLRWGRPFVALDAERRAGWLALWSNAGIGPMRNFVKLIRSCALLAYYDHPALAAALAKPAGPT